jgi:3-hydroxyisobutyrate dehydrogenase-like beta-hydroxyacid dehydrogenase
MTPVTTGPGWNARRERDGCDFEGSSPTTTVNPTAESSPNQQEEQPDGTRFEPDRPTRSLLEGAGHRRLGGVMNGATPHPAEGHPTVAILGTGKMGSAIAARLGQAGFKLTLWNRTRERAEALGLGQVAATPASAATGATIVISSLTGPEAVRAAYLGPDGALGAGDGKLFIEMSTAGPDVATTLASKVASVGGRLLDAPIIGAPPLLREGKATIVVGGDAVDVGRAAPVLETFGAVRHVGPSGSGARLKLVANSMLADVVLAAAELQVAGEDAGLDPDDVFWMLERFAPAIGGRRRGYLEHRHEPALFAMRDLLKDLDLALGLFGSEGDRTPLTALARTLVADTAWESPDLDITAVIRPYRKAASSRWIDPASHDPASTDADADAGGAR